MKTNNTHNNQLLEDEQGTQLKQYRKRSNTVLKLKWIAEKLRKAAAIHEKVHDDKYSIDTKSVAKALLNLR